MAKRSSGCTAACPRYYRRTNYQLVGRASHQCWQLFCAQVDALSYHQRDLLYVIAGQDKPHGLAIKDELEAYYENEIHHGRLYPHSDQVVDKGLVEKAETDN